MSKGNFIGKQLINIKDRIPGKPGTQTSVLLKTPETVADSQKNAEKQPIVQNEPELEQNALIEPAQIKKEVKEAARSVSKPDKEYMKVLQAKKEDYFKTKNVVIKMLADTFSELNKEIDVMNQKKGMYAASADSVKKLLDDISKIEESKWDSDDFSIELSEAERIIEKSRLENIILKEKLNLKAMEESRKEIKNGISILDIVSLSFSQVFKLGLGFFLPLIVGVVIAALIVAVTILVSMGTL